MELLDVLAIGEYLVDFTPCGLGPVNNPLYEMNPGGAPANCLAACAALGGKTAMIGAVGEDLFGKFLIKKLKESGILTQGIQETNRANTTLVFVSLDDDGEREFVFVRDPGADTMIDAAEVDLSLIEKTRIVHFGSLSMTGEPARKTTEYVIKKAREMGKRVSYDPNYRESLWASREEAIFFLKKGLEWADSVKMSEEELKLLLGEADFSIEKGIRQLINLGISNVYITVGEKGAYYGNSEEMGFVEGFSVEVVDTTGCGDAFNGAILYLDTHIPTMPMREKVRFANAVGALCATKRGGLPAMPSLEEVRSFMQL